MVGHLDIFNSDGTMAVAWVMAGNLLKRVPCLYRGVGLDPRHAGVWGTDIGGRNDRLTGGVISEEISERFDIDI
jgi:hypothetical protein